MSPQFCRAFVIARMLFPDFVNVSPNYELYPFFPKIGFVVMCFSAEKEQSQSIHPLRATRSSPLSQGGKEDKNKDYPPPPLRSSQLLSGGQSKRYPQYEQKQIKQTVNGT